MKLKLEEKNSPQFYSEAKTEQKKMLLVYSYSQKIR